MRNFTAYAAREAATFALLHPTPQDVADVCRHLIALGPDAPAARHLDIVEADAALEDANEATTTARKLTGVARNLAVNAADTQLRDAVRNAERLILAVEPTAARFRGVDMPVTPDTITAAALDYMGVRASAEELRAIPQGTPMVQVRCKPDPRLGREITARISAGVPPSWAGATPIRPSWSACVASTAV